VNAILLVEPVPRRRLYRVECITCGAKHVQTTKAFAIERAKEHKCELVDPREVERVDL
jgi:hypothetical protein